MEKRLAKKFTALFLTSVILSQPITVLAETGANLLPAGEPEVNTEMTTTSSIEEATTESSATASSTVESTPTEDTTDIDLADEVIPEVQAPTEVETPQETEIPADENIAEEVEWNYLAFGESASASKNRYTVNPDGSVTIVSEKGGGKLLTNGADGLGFYYTPISKDDNFTLKAKVTVDTWTYSNAQEGFLVMARDAVPETASTAAHFSNSFAFMGGRYEYTWDSANEQISANGDTKYTMRLGVGARYIADVPDAGTHTTNVVTVPLERAAVGQAAGTYNIMNKAMNLPNASVTNLDDQMLTTFDVTLKKTNSGFEILYTDPNTGTSYQETYWDWENLFQIDGDNVYVGFAAARNMTITVSDIELSTIDPADDEPARERPKEVVELTTNLSAPTTSGTADYQARFNANADGTLEVRDAETNEILVADLPVTASESTLFDLALTEGTNRFAATFTPDENYFPGELQIMDSYEPVALTPWSVDYRAAYYDTLYVTPYGSTTGTGSIEAPLDIYTAVSYAKPGTTIVLQGGTYHLTKGITIGRNINGTKEEPITFRAESVDDRPVLDFGDESAGLLHWGSNWHFYGFDVTNTMDKQKGFTISGHDNIIENIHAYNNGDTGIQISGVASEGKAEWPRNNLVKNSTSYNNFDAGFEDADGFAAKLTVGEGNVFDGCISYHNADDGWDLFARTPEGEIGVVTIKNSVAYENGFIPGDERTGNGNGFKMGGSSIAGAHVLINSLAFENLAKGIDSNSGPDINVRSSTSINNQSYNVALYTTNPQDTNFTAEGVLSFRTDYLSMQEQLRPDGAQGTDSSQIWNATNFYWDVANQQSLNNEGAAIDDAVYESTDTKNVNITRYDNGSINVNGLMQPMATTVAADDVQIGAVFTEDTTPGSELPEVELISEANTTAPTNETNPIVILEADGNTTDPEANLFAGVNFTIGVHDFLPNAGEPVEGDAYFVPVSYRLLAAEGEFAGTEVARANLFTAELVAPAAGTYNLEVTYDMSILIDGEYVNVDQTVTQTRSLTILALATEEEDETTDSSTTESSQKPADNQDKDKDDLPQTSDHLNLSAVLGGLIALMTALGLALVKLKKKKVN